MSVVPRVARRVRLLLGLSLASALGAAGCGLTGPSGPLDRERERLAQARAHWRGLGFTDYQYTFRRNCFCGPDVRDPVRIVVRQGNIVSIERLTAGPPPDPQFYYTVEGLFDLLADAIENDAHQLQADYDSAFGYPVSAFIDYNAQLADEEQGFEASALQPLRR